VDFIDALSQLLETKQLTKMALHKKLGVSRQTLDNYLDRITSPTDAEIKEMSKKLDISTLVKSYPEQVKMIPFYDAVAVGGTSVQAEQDPITKPMEMINPGTWFKTAQGSLRVYGHSMFPKYPSGSIIAFKNGADHAHKIIHYGEDYVIELDDLRIIKRVQKSKEKDCIQVNSYNTMKDDTGAQVFAPYDIPLAAIRRMYRVLGKVELEASI
jgi:phage repressor protein C with HTH and peptisase S24 domain